MTNGTNDSASSNASYDVFLSFNSDDREIVEKLAIYLADSVGLEPWYDKWNLIPGESWVKTLHRGLSQAQTCAAFVGPSGTGPWQRPEIETALIRKNSGQEFRIIPVLLPGVDSEPELPPWLEGLMWTDLRAGLDDDDALWRLESRINC